MRSFDVLCWAINFLLSGLQLKFIRSLQQDLKMLKLELKRFSVDEEDSSLHEKDLNTRLSQLQRMRFSSSVVPDLKRIK